MAKGILTSYIDVLKQMRYIRQDGQNKQDILQLMRRRKKNVKHRPR